MTEHLAATLTRDDTVCALRRHRADFQRLGVSHLYLFGSAAREEMSAISDVDLFFDHRRGEVGLFEVMDIRDRATAILGRAADVTTRAGLHPRLRMAIESEALRIF